MSPSRPFPFAVRGDLTLLELILFVHEFTASAEETTEVVSYLLRAGGIRLRTPGAAGPSERGPRKTARPRPVDVVLR